MICLLTALPFIIHTTYNALGPSTSRGEFPTRRIAHDYFFPIVYAIFFTTHKHFSVVDDLGPINTGVLWDDTFLHDADIPTFKNCGREILGAMVKQCSRDMRRYGVFMNVEKLPHFEGDENGVDDRQGIYFIDIAVEDDTRRRFSNLSIPVGNQETYSPLTLVGLIDPLPFHIPVIPPSSFP